MQAESHQARQGSRTRWVIMGVSGCGKSTIGSALASSYAIPFLEGDAFHPQRNVTKMASGVPLDDTDRAGWLQALAAELEQAQIHDRGLVLSCSALKRRYRDLLRAADPQVRFVHLAGPRELIAERMHARPGKVHESQLRILEPLQPDEDGLTLDITQPPAALVERITASS
jgi:gluconokinase